jgi:6,7-dimethyl-8-ribityllumazine synthase
MHTRKHHQTRAGAARPNAERHGVAQLQAAEVPDARVAVIASTFNAAIVERLVDGALGVLTGHGIDPANILLLQVPGAWELPQAAQRIAAAGNWQAIVALGCVIRGETSHYEVIVNESARGLMQVALDRGIPVANGVLACHDEEQALARAGGGEGNKGAEAAEAALEMLGILRAAAV